MSDPRHIDLATLTPGDSLKVTLAVAAAHLVCFPTDTVYGVGGALNMAVAEVIATAKHRDPSRPLQVIFSSRELLLETVSMSAALRDVTLRLMPGPVTLLVPYPKDFVVPEPGKVTHTIKRGLLRSPREETVLSLGVRVPNWSGAASVLGTLPFPLLASSANPSGGEAPRRVADVEAGVRSACDLVLDGGTVDGRPSTVVDFTFYDRYRSWRILRPGAWTEAEISEKLACKREDLPRS